MCCRGTSDTADRSPEKRKSPDRMVKSCLGFLNLSLIFLFLVQHSRFYLWGTRLKAKRLGHTLKEASIIGLLILWANSGFYWTALALKKTQTSLQQWWDEGPDKQVSSDNAYNNLHVFLYFQAFSLIIIHEWYGANDKFRRFETQESLWNKGWMRQSPVKRMHEKSCQSGSERCAFMKRWEKSCFGIPWLPIVQYLDSPFIQKGKPAKLASFAFRWSYIRCCCRHGPLPIASAWFYSWCRSLLQNLCWADGKEEGHLQAREEKQRQVSFAASIWKISFAASTPSSILQL